MKLLVTGAGGRLGAQIVSRAEQQGLEVDPLFHHPPARSAQLRHTVELSDPEVIEQTVERSDPDWIIHTAALTDVDACERDPDLAFKINDEATRILAEGAKRAEASFMYVSTDYVFGGERGGYRESDPVDPINHYGRSKAKGEESALAALPDSLIVRPSVLFGPGKPDFVRWVIQSLRRGNPVSLAVDQIVSPTFTPDLAGQILELVRREERGVWHTAGPQPLSRFEMGATIATSMGLDRKLLEETRCEDLPWTAERPKDSSLNVEKIQQVWPARTFAQAIQDLLIREGEPQYKKEAAH